MSEAVHILVVDDDTVVTEGLAAILAEEGYRVEVANDGRKALDMLLAERFAVVVADVHMPGMDGMALLDAISEHELPTRCVIMTGSATIPMAIDAIQRGAVDYIQKPLNAESLSRLRRGVANAAENFRLRESVATLTSRLEGLTHYGEITGESEDMRKVYSVIDAVAPSLASVLICGESGTGKELVARAVHDRSPRAKGPFLALNCAALPKDILENELFGHEKGAFTGSVGDKPGAFELANGGTLFLDEVAEMPPDIQVKLLRALESRSIRRLGGRKEVAVDIRVVAATNRDVHAAMADGSLREDLYYRLAVVEILLPPLRARVGDVKLLASEFLTRFAKANGKVVRGFDDSAWEWVLSYTWPGNVRELKNAVERAVILTRSDVVSREDIVPIHMRDRISGTFSMEAGMPMALARRLLVLRTLSSCGGDKERGARILGIDVGEIDSELRYMLGEGRGTEGAGGSDQGEPRGAGRRRSGKG